MDLALAQRAMRVAYVGGGPGVVVSGVIWAIAGITEQMTSVENGFVALFFGGMLIFPVSTLIVRQLMTRPPPDKNNQLGNIALESTIAMLGGMFAAYLFLQSRPEWVLPLMAIAVGTHYFAFATLYGNRSYWALGAAISAVGLVVILLPEMLPGGAALPVAGIEMIAGGMLTVWSIRSDNVPA